MKKSFIAWIVVAFLVSLLSFFFIFPVFYVAFPTLILYVLAEITVKEDESLVKHKRVFNLFTIFWASQSLLDVILYYIWETSWLYSYLI